MRDGRRETDIYWPRDVVDSCRAARAMSIERLRVHRDEALNRLRDEADAKEAT
jgi:hypothetical protein